LSKPTHLRLRANFHRGDIRRRITRIATPTMTTTQSTTTLDSTPAASRAAWLDARLELLKKEKELTRLQDELSRQVRHLPWVKVPETYRFEGSDGAATLADLFGPHRQLAVYHFMLGAGWDEGCKSCSFIADHLDGMLPHLAARDVALIAVSHAPWAEIVPFRLRMGWKFPWYSSHGSLFNHDFHVSFTPEQMAVGEVDYNYAKRPFPFEEAPGFSIFAQSSTGDVYHTYSTYGRGVERLMGTYRVLDIVPKGRAEENLEYGMQWVRHHDRYETAPPSVA
jgi:predicted dithiol-disulfide oxidoreductase (DUF899 family)